MDFLRPASWEEALAALATDPEALPIAGGTDVMVEVTFGRRRPRALLDLSRVHELYEWSREADGRIRLGASVPYARLIAELGAELPGLAMAARTVGSPQIRNRGSVGGNLGAASPAGDMHPMLLATDAVIEVDSAARGTRQIPAARFYLGVKRNALESDELIRAILLEPAKGPQQFSKAGPRNAMVIAVCSVAVALDVTAWKVGIGIGSAAPTPRRARSAEEFIEAGLPWAAHGDLDPGLVEEFGAMVARAASPIDDIRGGANYRRHALSVMARRALTWAWHEFTTGFATRSGPCD